MKTLEIVLLLGAYSTIVVTLFISLICYRRNLERWETVSLITSLLLLILAIGMTALFDTRPDDLPTNVFILISMVLVGFTTPLSILEERKHRLPDFWKKVITALAGVFLICIIIGSIADRLVIIETPVVIFLASSVVASMVFMQMTKPKQVLAHQEKINRIFSILFLVIVPLSLFATYAPSMEQYDLSIGFALPLIFILLSLNKLLDDLRRLSLIKPVVPISEQHFERCGLTEREREVASLLAKGKTYKNICEDLYISMPTVKTHAGNIYRKCRVKNRHELTMLLIT